MSFSELSLLAIIQGIAEFLPISSSAHLILFPALTGGRDQGLVIDAALHVGTLAAVMLYFRRETLGLARGGLGLLQGRAREAEPRFALLLIFATIPLLISGAAIALAGLDEAMRSTGLIAATTLIFGALLWLGDRHGASTRAASDWGWRDALALGLAQAVAIIPGVSRSGVTMSMARALGFRRTEAARLSLLMSIPATMAVGGWVGVKMARAGADAPWADAAIAAGLAFVAALAALAFLMRMLRGWSFTPFVVYRLALGALLVSIALG